MPNLEELEENEDSESEGDGSHCSASRCGSSGDADSHDGANVMPDETNFDSSNMKNVRQR